MTVRGITVHVKENSVEDFKKAILENREGSIQEPGIYRFDVLQSEDDPAVFFLYEVYADEAATLAHKETAHYLKWRETVEPMMAEKRIGKAYTPISPVDPSRWQAG